jgi:hypothetical protein
LLYHYCVVDIPSTIAREAYPSGSKVQIQSEACNEYGMAMAFTGVRLVVSSSTYYLKLVVIATVEGINEMDWEAETCNACDSGREFSPRMEDKGLLCD